MKSNRLIASLVVVIMACFCVFSVRAGLAPGVAEKYGFKEITPDVLGKYIDPAAENMNITGKDLIIVTYSNGCLPGLNAIKCINQYYANAGKKQPLCLLLDLKDFPPISTENPLYKQLILKGSGMVDRTPNILVIKKNGQIVHCQTGFMKDKADGLMKALESIR